MKKKIIIMCCFIALIGVVFGIIDYNRIMNMEEPIFMISVTSGDGEVWHYVGLGYRMKRDVSVSKNEEYYLDNEVRFGLWLYTWKLNFKASVSYVYTIDVEKSSSCSKNLYYGEENRNIYLYCLDSIKVNDNEKVELKDYLVQNNKSIDDFIKMFLVSNEYKDGESRLYKELGDTENVNGFTNNGLSILECNTLEGNKDIYLGPLDMEYEESFCKFDDSMKEYSSFIRTYNVRSIHLDDKSDEYVYLVLSSFQGEENVEVKVLKSLINNVKIGYNYEFIFRYLDSDFDDNVKSIFENTTLMEIRETDKVGLEQTQESFKVEEMLNDETIRD